MLAGGGPRARSRGRHSRHRRFHRFGDALVAFTRAAALQPGDASLGLGAGLAAFMLGQNDIAQSRLESALSLDPA